MARKFSRIFDELSSEQQEHFERWLTAELDGQQKKVAQLLDLHLKRVPEEERWARIFPGKEEGQSKILGRLYGDLTEWLEEFLAIEAFRQDHFAKNRRLLAVYNGLDQPQDFQKTWRKILKRLERQPQRDEQFHRLRFELELEKAAHLIKYPGRKNEQAQTITDRKEWYTRTWLHAWLPRYVIQLSTKDKSPPIEGMELATAILHTAGELAHEWKDVVLDLWFRLAKLQLAYAESSVREPAVYLEKIVQLMHAFRQSFELFVQFHQFDFYVQLSNLLSSLRKQAQNKGEILQHQQTWIEWAMENGWALVEGKLPTGLYANYSVQALLLGNLLPETEQARHFQKSRTVLEIFRAQLPQQEQQSRWNFHRLQLLFAEGNYREFARIYGSLQKLDHPHPWPTPRNEVEIRLMELHSRFHLGEGLFYFPPTEKSLREFCQKQATISPQFKLKMKAHLRCLRKFYRCKSPQQFQNLYQEVKGTAMHYQTALLKLIAGKFRP